MLTAARNPVACLAILLAAAGCSPESAKRYEYGIVRPNLNFQIDLADPLPPSKLYEISIQQLHGHAFNELVGPPKVASELNADVGRTIVEWKQLPAAGGYSAAFVWDHDGSGSVASLWFLFEHRSIDDFTLHEWLQFAYWKDQALPAAFPGAVIKNQTHPAEFTSTTQHRRLSRLSGVDLPTKYAQDDFADDSDAGQPQD